MSEGVRIDYLCGFLDCVLVCSGMVMNLMLDNVGQKDKEKLVRFYRDFCPKGTRRDEISRAVTRLYENPVNVRLSIPWVIYAAGMQFQGSSASDVEKYLEACRQDASEMN